LIRIIKSILSGLFTYVKALKFIYENKLTWFYIFPLLLSLTLFIFVFYFSGVLSDKVFNLLIESINLDSVHNGIISFLIGLLKGSIWFISKFLFFFVYAYVGGYIILMLMSPVLAWLSEKTEKIVTGKDYPFVLNIFLKDVWRGIILAIRNFIVEMFFIVAIFILAFVPVLGWLSNVIGIIFLFFISAYFYGFSFMDYYIERKKLNTKQSIVFMRNYKDLAIGNGFVFAIILLFPFAGSLLAPFVAIISVVAATLVMEEEKLIS